MCRGWSEYGNLSFFNEILSLKFYRCEMKNKLFLSFERFVDKSLLVVLKLVSLSAARLTVFLCTGFGCVGDHEEHSCFRVQIFVQS